MALKPHELKKLTIPLFTSSKVNWNSVFGNCNVPVVSLNDVIGSYIAANSVNLVTDLTLQGKGSATSPLKIAQQSATNGQVLVWNGTTWVPGNVNTTLSYTTPFLTLNGNPSVDISSFISSDAPNLLTIGTDSEFKVQIYKDSTLSGDGTQAAPLKIAQQGATNGDILKWNGTTWFPDNTPFSAALDDLTDVTITSPTTGQALVYNGSTWENDSVGTVPATAASGDMLYYNGSAWVAASPKKNIQIINSGSQVTLPHTPLVNTVVDVYFNGLLKEEGVDYTINTNLITFSFNFATNDKITTKYFA